MGGQQEAVANREAVDIELEETAVVRIVVVGIERAEGKQVRGRAAEEGLPELGGWDVQLMSPHRMGIRNKKGRLLFHTSGKSR